MYTQTSSRIPRLARHVAPGGGLLVTVGPSAREVMGTVEGDPVYHASLSIDEYEVCFRGRGLGFPLAGNFYPDFLLWLVDDKTCKQWLSFIDPKGIRNMNISDPKFGLYREIKQIESQLGIR